MSENPLFAEDKSLVRSVRLGNTLRSAAATIRRYLAGNRSSSAKARKPLVLIVSETHVNR